MKMMSELSYNQKNTGTILVLASFTNGYRIYVDIMTGEKLSSIQAANMKTIFLKNIPLVGLGKGVVLGERY